MKDIKVGLESVTVVIKGSFNPAIFSPLWLRNQGLIGSPEMSEQDIDIISRDIAIFRAGWLSVQVAGDGLQFSTSNMEEAERLRDVAIGALRRLEHLPLQQLDSIETFTLPWTPSNSGMLSETRSLRRSLGKTSWSSRACVV